MSTTLSLVDSCMAHDDARRSENRRALQFSNNSASNQSHKYSMSEFNIPLVFSFDLRDAFVMSMIGLDYRQSFLGRVLVLRTLVLQKMIVDSGL